MQSLHRGSAEDGEIGVTLAASVHRRSIECGVILFLKSILFQSSHTSKGFASSPPISGGAAGQQAVMGEEKKCPWLRLGWLFRWRWSVAAQTTFSKTASAEKVNIYAA